jgi:hypothetical protein
MCNSLVGVVGGPGAADGAGTYSVSIRVKDGYAQLSKAVGFSFLPGV